MAYINQEGKKRIEPKVKAICKKHGVAGRLSIRHHMTLVLTCTRGKIDFFNEYSPGLAKGHLQVNTYHYRNHFSGPALAFLDEVLAAMNEGNHDNSDIQTDYFDVGWYVAVNIGKWDKAYELESA